MLRRILVVDDNADLAASLVAMLEMHEYSACASVDVAHALNALDEDPSISMVVSDVRMPSVDGLDFVRVLRHRFPSLPVVLMTGLPISEDDVLPRGVVILEKPFVFEKLLTLINDRLDEVE